jgi:hypothetical protein
VKLVQKLRWTDTITVELGDTSAPYNVVSSLKIILHTNGNASVIFPISGTYYLAVRHRNSLATWSTNPITLSALPQIYDFSDAANKAYGNNQVSMGGGVYAFYSVDVVEDENIDLSDLTLIDNGIVMFLSGYQAIDINGNANVDILDTPDVEINTSNFIFSAHP